jgi:hypothetical protein
MIEKRIEVCIGTDRTKHMRARLSLLLVDGDQVINEHYHSIAIEPGADLAALRAANEAHIGNPTGGVPGAPWPKIPDTEWQEVEQCVGVIQKPEVVSRHKARVAAEAARQAELERINRTAAKD